MSKAFTKESDGEGEDEAPEASGASEIPKGTRNYITPEGSARLKAELKRLLLEDRPELVRVISWAASNGDRSENGDYIYGKRKLREIDRRIRFLSKRIESFSIVDPAQQKSDRVLFGATVTVQDVQDAEDAEDTESETPASARRTYQIVGIDETDPAKGKVSWISPIARALMNAREGDVVALRTPQGERELLVIGIRYV